MNTSQINALIKTAYPQALSKLVVRINNINHAEDFLQSAVEQALLKWPISQPDNAVAWLVKVAQNRYIDFYRRQKKQVNFDHIAEEAVILDLSEESLLLTYNDDLLRLIFTCCHPALNRETQIALSLKHVLGLSIAQIANALVVSDKTLEQRLTRAKKKIIVNNIRYEIPTTSQWSERLDGVLKTIYLLFNEGYLTTQDDAFIRQSLCKEAIRLARLLHACVKDEVSIIGLLALLVAQDARQPARMDTQGNMILLADQDRALWKKTSIQEANILVEKALRMGGAAPYAVQAAIASLHNNASSEEVTDWQQIYGLYQLLMQQDDNPVIELNSAIALAKSGHMAGAIKNVLYLRERLKNYRHYHTTLAGLYFEDGQYQLASDHYHLALRKTKSMSEITFIGKRIKICESSCELSM